MTLLNASALFFSLLALPIVLLYILKLRRRQVEITSILLWQMLLRDRQANTPWQKLRRNLLLFLQLLILTSLVLAVSRPAIPVASITTGSLVVLLDASASMNTLEESTTRFETSQALVRELIQDLSSGEKMTLIQVGTQPIVLAVNETNKDRLFSALDQAAPSHGSSDWSAALALAAGTASQSGQNNTTLVVSDGGIPQEGLPSIPGEVRYIPIGETGENLAITALALRSTGQSVELFSNIKNYGNTNQSLIFSLYANNKLIEAHSFDISGGGERALTISGLPNMQSVYFARLTPTEAAQNTSSTHFTLDAFDLDNSAYAIYQPPRTGRVLVVTPGNLFVEQVLAAMHNITPFRYKSEENVSLQLPQDPFDCYVFDGVLPENLPVGNLLLINPSPNELFDVTGSFAPIGIPHLPDHTITADLDWSNVHIAQASQLQTPSWAEVLVEIDGNPIVFIGETEDYKLAVLMFDLHQSDLPLQVAFPILMANLLDYLVPSYGFKANNGILPGDTLLIRSESFVNQVDVASPSGKTFSYTPSSNGILFTETHELGLFTVTYLQDNSQNSEYFAVNLFDAQESNIQPRSSLNIGKDTIQASVEDRLSMRELWPLMVVLGLLTLVVEWWVYHRYTHVGRSL